MSSALRTSTKRLLHPGYTWRAVAARGISSSSRDCKAHNFNMPALSPTMTEGSIASWKISEGDKFAAGDVILEVETDKAQMDVEAQDDGILAKIFVQASKDQIQVGTRIGILADVDDDIASLEIPPEDSPIKTESAEPEKPAPQSAPAPSKSKPAPTESSSEDASSSHPHKPRKNPFVASPGITHLLHMNGLEMSDVKGTGPGGRVLKGDVLAHLGKIDKDKPKSVAGEIAKLAKLDLSNIKPKPIAPKDTAKKDDIKKPKKVNPLDEIEVSMPISLARVSDGARPVADSIARAVEYANSGLPESKIPPTTSELFDEILGIPVTKAEPRYTVKSSDYKPTPTAPVLSDLFDEIIGVATPKPAAAPSLLLKEFKVKVPAVDKDRAEFFLAKVKFSLEQDERR
ncbi:hypothetical protein H072_2063 [Dactylellina haptotyla CBS 200.50]|uniref:Uncharacterized protein n=1 Tax=Dactylellina haptotyla (strain CBS 200.50) TaxID=1284197 RepID=S8ASK7_DACHA|nr:hypothetical protein H072_2063 [Dactylellina haptotyla CBS 200.50]